VKAGDYGVLVEKRGFFAPPLQLFSLPVHVGVGQDVVSTRIEMQPAASLSGIVFGLDGKPAPRIEVSLGIVSTITQEDGNFNLSGLTPGTRTLVASPPASNPTLMGDGIRTSILPTFYPSTTELNSAEPVTVTAGRSLTGYDIHLQSAPVYRVRGVVLNPLGTPAARAIVRVLPVLGDPEPPAFVVVAGGTTIAILGSGRNDRRRLDAPQTVTNQSGRFEFSAVPEGDWTIAAESDPAAPVEGLPKNAVLHGEAEATIARHDLDDLRIQFDAPFDLKAKVEPIDDKPTPDEMKIQVMLLGSRTTLGSRTQAGDLRFLNVIPGRYRIVPMPPISGNYYVASVLLGDIDVTNQLVYLSPGVGPLRIIVKPASGAVRGTVQKGEGAFVVILPRTLRSGDLVRSTASGPNGGFEFTGIPPGEYYAIAVARLDPQDLASPAYAREIAATATSVRVENNFTVSVDLKVTHLVQ
jgi:hypothetical protein